MCTTPCAAPCRATFQTAQNLLLNQMRLTQPYSQYVALQRELRTLEDTYTAAAEAHDPEGFAACLEEDERQAAYHHANA